MGRKNKGIDAQIKSYEALMHRVLKDYNVTTDYEDLLQEMRIVVWKALIDTNPKTMYIADTSKFTTFLYNIMKNRLINIFIIEYKMRPKKKLTEEEVAAKKKVNGEEEEEEELPFKKRSKRSLARPTVISDLSFEQQINALQNQYDAEAIRLKTDISTFFNTLKKFEQQLWLLNLEGWTQEEIVIELAKKGIKRDRTTVSRRLKKVNNKFVKFMQEGEL